MIWKSSTRLAVYLYVQICLWLCAGGQCTIFAADDINNITLLFLAPHLHCKAFAKARKFRFEMLYARENYRLISLRRC
jgi:hypothetical protein